MEAVSLFWLQALDAEGCCGLAPEHAAVPAHLGACPGAPGDACI